MIRPIHLALFTLIFVAFIAYVLPNVSEATKLATGSERSPDTSFFYTADDVYEIAKEYGPKGRSYYIKSRLTFDVVWPIAYGLFLTAALSRLLSKVSNRLKWLVMLNLLPILGVALDYLENFATATAMYVYPKTIFLAGLAPYFTVLKWLCLYASFGIVFIGILIMLILKLKSHGGSKS
jgi:hypothetical protein